MQTWVSEYPIRIWRQGFPGSQKDFKIEKRSNLYHQWLRETWKNQTCERIGEVVISIEYWRECVWSSPNENRKMSRDTCVPRLFVCQLCGRVTSYATSQYEFQISTFCSHLICHELNTMESDSGQQVLCRIQKIQPIETFWNQNAIAFCWADTKWFWYFTCNLHLLAV